MHPTRFQKQCMLKEWKLMNPQGNEWNHLYLKITKTPIAGKGYNSMNHYNLVHKFVPMPQAMKNSGCKGSSGHAPR